MKSKINTKKLCCAFLVVILSFALLCCDKEETTVSEAASEQAGEYSGAVYTVRVDREDGGYVLQDYREDGVLLEERLHYSYLKSKSVYGADGNIKEVVVYYPSGEIVNRKVYTVEGFTLCESIYDKDGNYGGKTKTSYNEQELISSKAIYDQKDVLLSSTSYLYDEYGAISRKEMIDCIDGFPCVTTNQSFDGNGEVITEEIVEYTEEGEFKLHEVYRFTEDDVVLEAKYDEMGNPLPIEG